MSIKAVFARPAGDGTLNTLFNIAYHDRGNPMWARQFMGKHATARRKRGEAKRLARGQRTYLP
jgi:hypothetical protein